MCGEKNKTSVRRNRCGQEIGEPPCSEVFRHEYGIDDFKAMLFYNSRKYRYHEIFDDFPKKVDKKTGFVEGFDLCYFEHFAQGLFEHVESMIRKKENQNPAFAITNIKSFVASTVSIFLEEYKRDLQNIHEATVNEDILCELRLLLFRSDLTEDDLKPLAKSSKSSAERDLLDEIKSHPGYRGIWFKLKNEKGTNKLVMYFTEQDISDKFNFVVSKSVPEEKDGNPGIFSLEERFENFYKILNERERCVYRYRIKQALPARDVIDICWDKPVAPSSINNVLNGIVKKVKENFLGMTDG